ncbi:MAG: sulfite exporter TauE/SafE family protein [Desulfurella sp.]|uniref:sulfite exporter TauE/SafE family protein n=1 Tax=Desulfurella sp. TaxID=1962857 RepID=UPI003D13D8AE
MELIYGTIIGLTLGLTGAGGSIITIPILLYLLDMNVHSATGTSLIVVGVGSLAGAIQYMLGKQKYVHWKISIVFSIAGIFGAFLGSYINSLLPAKIILFGFSALMLIIGILMLRQKEYQNKKECEQQISLKNIKGLSAWSKFVLAGFGIGLITGFFGVGGGFLIVPTLVLILDFPMKDAIATSLLVIALNCLWGILSRLSGVGSIEITQAIYISVGAIIGMAIGVVIAKRIKAGYLTRIFSYFVIILAFYMFARTLGLIH